MVRDADGGSEGTHPELLLLCFEVGQLLVLLLECLWIPMKVADDESDRTLAARACQWSAAYLFSRHLCMYSSLTFLNTVTVCNTNSESEARRLRGHGSITGQSKSLLAEASRTTHCVLRGTTILVSRSYFSSQSRVRFLGTATRSVSKNSESSTRSPVLTTSSKDRCDKLPLRRQLSFDGYTYVRFRSRLVKLPLARL